MDTKDYRAKKYHDMVWWEAKKETKHAIFGEIQNLVGDLIIAILSGIAYAFWSYVRQGTMIDWLGVFVSVIVGFFGWGLIVFIYNGLWKIPAKMYRTKQSSLIRLTWGDVEIQKYLFPNHHGINIGFRIVNDKENSIENVSANVTEFTQGIERVDTTGVNLSLLQHSLLAFRVCSQILKRSDEKHVKVFSVLPIAKIRDGRAWLAQNNENKEMEIKPEILCHIRIDLNGYTGPLGNQELSKCSVFCTLFFDGKKVEIKEWERSPEYEN